MATQSTSTSVGVGSSNEPTIVEVLETTRNKEIWQHYDLCKMSMGSKKGRCKLARDALKMWKNAKLELINGFENLNTSVNLTTDVWSAPHGLPGSYLCVTAHWVDPATWQMMKRTIDFENFDYPHTGANLFRSSEIAFSLSGRVLSIRRTKLTPASLEMCICLKDHLDAQERIQHTSNLEGDCLEIEQQLHEVEAEAGYAINIADEEIVLEEQDRSGSGDSE
ncbi:hypothetical protein Tco_1019891 [Tanacetum coccineum]|uniref:HAT C-terminal dimerisation domain-containing protein n=1 Tax=Tanacetum coccineum TaxID=301880 RepID=A0ABQ5FYP9_9ASTR